MAKRFTVILDTDTGYRAFRVYADDWKLAEEKARDMHIRRNQNEGTPGCAGVIKGWPETWGC